MFPLKNYKYTIPIGQELGAFGVVRKHDIHTGVDLYCEKGDKVYAMETGVIIAIEYFTGPSIGMPWWNDTMAVAILGKSGIINYGEISPSTFIRVGDTISEGDEIGYVTPVLIKDKGKVKVPSTSMLHLELYSEYHNRWEEWELNEPKPTNLEDPTQLLRNALAKQI